MHWTLEANFNFMKTKYKCMYWLVAALTFASLTGCVWRDDRGRGGYGGYGNGRGWEEHHDWDHDHYDWDHR